MVTITAAANAGAVRITGTDGATVVDVDLTGDIAVQFARDIVAKLLSVRAASLPGAVVPLATIITAVSTPAKRATVTQDFGVGRIHLTTEDDDTMDVVALQPDEYPAWLFAQSILAARVEIETNERERVRVGLSLLGIIGDKINPRSG